MFNIYNFSKEIYFIKIGVCHSEVEKDKFLLLKNKINFLMLIIKEMSKASIGYEEDLKDLNFPQYGILDIKMANVFFEACFLLGAEIEKSKYKEDFFSEKEIRNIWDESLFSKTNIRSTTLDGILMRLINILSLTVENYEDKKEDKAVISLFSFIVACEKFMLKSPLVSGKLEEIYKIKFHLKEKNKLIQNDFQ